MKIMLAVLAFLFAAIPIAFLTVAFLESSSQQGVRSAVDEMIFFWLNAIIVVVCLVVSAALFCGGACLLTGRSKATER